ncbi:hypothetical protein [Dehalobacterium formicoaceticum]|uniref:Uncharacterized protein n=1 Tax=Dehalobacterium formicoaceticum TaxID=51515 RepID=A0ABT1Y3M6_9FIRM|nr:hypothetical protein [Dehalobacterium formicoaceticum]MCR6545475.1 hypothetical protein [Dehalobacterium formicoaceticum]
MLDEKMKKIIDETGRIRRSTIENLFALQEELRNAGYSSSLDVSTNWLLVERTIQVDKTMNIYWENEGQKYTGVAHWYEDLTEKHISFTSDDGQQVLDRIDFEDCAIGVMLEDIWQDITDRKGDVTDFDLK